MNRLLTLLIALAALPMPATSALIDDPEVIRFVSEMSLRHGLDEATLRERFSATDPDPQVLRLIQPASTPTRRSWKRYRARFLTPQRIRGGVNFWNAHSETIERASARYGVPARIIVAIIGVETEYGRNTGGFNVFRALSTLAFAYPPRADFFRAELEQYLLLARENQLDIATVRGSFAGAIGIPQFMPGSERRFAVDFDGDGRIDLSDSVDDAIGSVASFLSAHGWRPGLPIAAPAAIAAAPPAGWVEAGIRPTLDGKTVAAAGIDARPIEPGERAALIDLVTPGGKTEYWWGFDNFYVITRYNRSSFYAMSVYHLGEAVANARAEIAGPR